MYLSSFEISLQSTDDDSLDYNKHANVKVLNIVIIIIIIIIIIPGQCLWC